MVLLKVSPWKKELRRQTPVRLGISGWTHGSSEGVTLEMCHPIQEEGKVRPQVY